MVFAFFCAGMDCLPSLKEEKGCCQIELNANMAGLAQDPWLCSLLWGSMVDDDKITKKRKERRKKKRSTENRIELSLQGANSRNRNGEGLNSARLLLLLAENYCQINSTFASSAVPWEKV